MNLMTDPDESQRAAFRTRKALKVEISNVRGQLQAHRARQAVEGE
jgi:hypothetical protein